MKSSLCLACLAVSFLCACQGGHIEAPGDLRSKVRMLTETLEEGDNCGQFRGRLEAAAADAEAVDRVYGEAKKAGCLKRDI